MRKVVRRAGISLRAEWVAAAKCLAPPEFSEQGRNRRRVEQSHMTNATVRLVNVALPFRIVFRTDRDSVCAIGCS